MQLVKKLICLIKKSDSVTQKSIMSNTELILKDLEGSET